MSDEIYARHIPYIRRNLGRGCTQRAVAEVLGISEQAVNSIARRYRMVRNNKGGCKAGRPAPLPLQVQIKEDANAL
jgi:transposase